MSANLSLRRRRITARVKAIAPTGPEVDLGLADIRDSPQRFLLVQENRGSNAHNQSHWFSTHKSAAGATTYIGSEEFPEDWQAALLVDLDTNIVYEPVTKVTWSVRADG